MRIHPDPKHCCRVKQDVQLTSFPGDAAALGDEDEVEQQQGPVRIQQQQAPRPGKAQLREFRPQAPNARFTAGELKFKVAHITSERERYAHTVGAIGF